MLDAAEREFGRAGLAAGSMEEIARASGVTKAMLFRYFGTKEGLYHACAERVRARLFDGLEEHTSQLPPGPPRLQAAIDTYFGFLERHRRQRWLLYADLGSGTVDAMRLLNAESIRRMLDEGLTVPVSDIDIDVLAHSIVGSGEEIGRWWLEQDDVPREEVVDRFLGIATAMIAQTIARQEAPR